MLILALTIEKTTLSCTSILLFALFLLLPGSCDLSDWRDYKTHPFIGQCYQWTQLLLITSKKTSLHSFFFFNPCEIYFYVAEIEISFYFPPS